MLKAARGSDFISHKQSSQTAVVSYLLCQGLLNYNHAPILACSDKPPFGTFTQPYATTVAINCYKIINATPSKLGNTGVSAFVEILQSLQCKIFQYTFLRQYPMKF